MYDLIYQFIMGYLFNSAELAEGATFECCGLTLNLAEWWGHSLTIVSMVLLFVLGIFMLRYVFKAVGGAFMGIGR